LDSSPSPRCALAGPVARGVFVLGNNDPEFFLRELRSALAALGRVDGENIIIDFRSARGEEARPSPSRKARALVRNGLPRSAL